MARSRVWLLLLILVLVGVSTLYLQDPWLWRRYTQTFQQLAGTEQHLLKPNEPVAGDSSFILQTAAEDARSVSELALRSTQEYAARFDSHALIVIHRGAIQAEWYPDGWDEYSLTQSQSMHKSLLAILIGTAIENGFIGSINDPVARYISEWEDDPRGDITLRELMMMSSGLAQYEFTLNPLSDDFRWLYSGDSRPVVLRTPLADWPPGGRFDYNNLNSEILGIVIENASGLRYAEYLQKALWQPLGAGEALVWMDSEFGHAHTSCCLMATARDWARIGLLMLNRGRVDDRRIVTGGWVDQMTAQSPVSKWYGLQTWLAYDEAINPRSRNASSGGAYDRTEPFLADDVYYFSGRGAQRVFVVPSRELVIVRLGPALGREPLKPGWDNAFLVNAVIRGIDQEAKNRRQEYVDGLPGGPLDRERDIPEDIFETGPTGPASESEPQITILEEGEELSFGQPATDGLREEPQFDPTEPIAEPIPEQIPGEAMPESTEPEGSRGQPLPDTPTDTAAEQPDA